jgi:AcrR family transcriptional regulator
MAQQRSKETRKQIMTAAVELLCRQGYDAASVAEICERAGVSKGAFYHHFPSKQKLFLSILDQWLGDLDTQLMSFRSPGKNISRTIQDMADTIGSVFSVASGQLPMFMEFMVQASRDKVIWDAAIEPYRDYQKKFAGLIEEGIKEGSFKEDTDPQIAARVLLSFSIGLLLQGIVMPDVADWENVAGQGVKMILESMQRSDG